MIRPYTPEDFERLYEIERECFSARFRWTKPQFKKHLNSESMTFVKEQYSGVILGFISLEKNYISTVDVEPKYQGLGLGSDLVNAAHDWMREQKYKTSRLHVYVKNPAQLLYLRLGYVAVKVCKNFYANGEHALEMEKQL